MHDDERKSEQVDALTESIRKAFDAKVGETIPEFGATWIAAEARVQTSKRRIRIIVGMAASIAVVAVIFNMLPPRQPPPLPDSELAAVLMSSLLWNAPSDSLMPEHLFDIYQDVPEIIQSTDLTKGLLL